MRSLKFYSCASSLTIVVPKCMYRRRAVPRIRGDGEMRSSEWLLHGLGHGWDMTEIKDAEKLVTLYELYFHLELCVMHCAILVSLYPYR